MEIETFTATELAAFIVSERYKKMPYLPITPLRAISQCANPQADTHDILLFLAVENGEMLGYCGMLPDTIYIKGRAEKVAWISGLWVNPAIRGKGIGKFLIKTALESYKNAMLVTEFIPETKKLYMSLACYQDMPALQGLTLYDIQKWDSLFVLKFTNFRSIFFLLKGISAITKPFFRLFLAKKTDNNLIFNKINEIDSATNAFIETKNKNALFRRNASDLNWLIHFPWMRKMPEKDVIAKAYYFSYQAQTFHQTWTQVKTKNEDKIVACFMLSVRDFNIKVPYFFAENAYIEPVAKWIFDYMQNSQASVFTLFQPELVAYFSQHKNLNYRTKKIEKPYMISTKFNLADITGLRIQDGDGDCVFT